MSLYATSLKGEGGHGIFNVRKCLCVLCTWRWDRYWWVCVDLKTVLHPVTSPELNLGRWSYSPECKPTCQRKVCKLLNCHPSHSGSSDGKPPSQNNTSFKTTYFILEILLLPPCPRPACLLKTIPFETFLFVLYVNEPLSKDSLCP